MLSRGAKFCTAQENNIAMNGTGRNIYPVQLVLQLMFCQEEILHFKANQSFTKLNLKNKKKFEKLLEAKSLLSKRQKASPKETPN